MRKEQPMSRYQAPGVYTLEPPGHRPIQGVGTAVAAFIGFAPVGRANEPGLITSRDQYVAAFGKDEGNGRRNPHMPGAYLSHAVAGYFANGGGRCYITRVVPPGSEEESAPLQAMLCGRSQQPLLLVKPRS